MMRFVCLAMLLALTGVTAYGQDLLSKPDPSEYFDPERLKPQPVSPKCYPSAPPGSLLAAASSAGRTAPTLAARHADWQAQIFRSANEPSLLRASKDSGRGALRTYRLTWTPSFDPWVVVRLEEISPGKFNMIATRSSGPHVEVPLGNNRFTLAPGAANERQTRALGEGENQALAAQLAKNRLQDLPEPDNCLLQGADGAGWFFEIEQTGSHRFFYEHSPQFGPMREIGEFFLSLPSWNTGAHN